MRTIVAELSLGRMVDRLARAIGWSPVGRWLKFTAAEGPHADRLEGRSVRVVAVAGCDLLVEMGPSEGKGPTTLRLTPRHGGWTAHSLMWVSIAAIVRLSEPGGQSEPIAIVTARLDRSATAGS